MHKLEKIQRLFDHTGGKVYAVGGFVRDYLLKGIPNDMDIEIHGVVLNDVREILKGEFGSINEVGKSFGVFKVGEFDISLPRKDSKTSPGHKGFDINVDPFMGIKEALRRRDFTINAMAYHSDGECLTLHDPYGGYDDLKNKILRIVDPQTFVEDPLRVLRGVQFASRFNLSIDPETFRLMRSLI